MVLWWQGREMYGLTGRMSARGNGLKRDDGSSDRVA